MLRFLWNLFLAVIPVALAWGLAGGIRRHGLKRYLWLWVLLGLAWLAFLPNTCYLLTGWRHYLGWLDEKDIFLQSQEDRRVMLRFLVRSIWFFGYTSMGLLTFTLAIRPLERLARELGWPVNGLAAPFFFLVAHGVYLGLVLRFNSWDLVTDPGGVIAAALEALARPGLLLLTAAFALFLWLGYLALDVWIDGLVARKERWQRARGWVPGQPTGDGVPGDGPPGDESPGYYKGSPSGAETV